MSLALHHVDGENREGTEPVTPHLVLFPVTNVLAPTTAANDAMLEHNASAIMFTLETNVSLNSILCFGSFKYFILCPLF